MSTWFDAGRRAGLYAVIAQLMARKQQLFEVYNAAKIERICDIYDIKYHEAEACLGIVTAALGAKSDDMFKGPVVSTKCLLPRIGSKDWAWTWDARTLIYTSRFCPYVISQAVDDFYKFEVYRIKRTGRQLVGGSLALCDAKVLAETCARREWRKENRKR